MRTVGVEEELLLVRSGSGQAMSVAPQVLRRSDEQVAAAPPEDGPGSSLGGELQRQQLEADTAPHETMAELLTELRTWRQHADDTARRTGTRVAALGTSPIEVEPRVEPEERYEQLVERFGLTATEQLTGGCHVHVQVDSDEEAVAVLDRVRVWLPALLALSSNSPFWQGQDSAYASYRSQAMSRWPSAGPPDAFGSAAVYRQTVAGMVATGVLLDAGMLYFDARVSERYPTLEIRVADVCQDPEDAVLVAALSRGLVETASRDWAAGRPAPDVPTSLLRLATWQAGRYGVSGDLLDPHSSRPRPAQEVLEMLLEHTGEALDHYGDGDLARHGLARVLRDGTGADHQRRTMERTGSISDVVAAAVRRTHGQEE